MTPGPAGRLMVPGRGAVDRALDRAAGGRPIPGNSVLPRIDGPAIFDAAEEIIGSARSWIHFDNYIIRDDATGRRFARLLSERARDGLRVRVLTDWLGSIATRRTFWQDLQAAGVSVRLFGPPRLVDLAANASRNHRKLVVADGSRALIGGFCIGDEWAGDPGRRRLPWRETAVEILGPAAAGLDLAFRGVWDAAGSPLSTDEFAAEVPAGGDAAVRVVAGEPGRLRAYRATELLIAGAADRIWITDAYFVAPRRIRDALVEAAREGVDVRLLVPGSSDLPFIRNLTRFGYRDLLRAGVRIFEWSGPMLHAKTAVVDGRWVRVGSTNVNLSSFLGNYELDVLIEDEALADWMENQYRRDLDASAEVKRRQVRVPQPIGRVLPTALAIEGPEESPPSHQPSLRERRQRTVRSLWALAAGARLSVFVPLSIAALLVGSMFFLLPRTMAAVFGLLSLWVAVAAGLHAAHRAERR